MSSSFVFMNLIDIVIAVVIDWIIGDPYWFPHPVIYIGKLISYLDKKGRKLCKKEESLKAFGGLIVFLVAFVSFIVPFAVLLLLRKNVILYNIVNTFIIWTTISAKCLAVEAKKVYYALKKEDIEDARTKLSYIVGRDTSSLSSQEIIRADVETVAENTSDGVIAPLIYAAIFGAPLAMLYKGINTMDSMLGYMNEKYRYIGFFPAKVDDVFNFIPSRITGVLMCISAFVVKGNPFKSFKIMIRDRKNHKSPNCAYPEAAAAGAMRIQLGGTNVYFGQVVYKPTIGDRLMELSFKHIGQCIIIMYFTEILFMILCGIVIIGLPRA
ncbi:Cobalamin biosynthesis protein CbiB [Clostridium ljungdahlii DSM 13528]|uniref:Cobalamin biosynthesis protein CobD n=2 Tax=Clostridium ljungdahlii TaxID=1538 RepID=D8GQU3_CLOLD|nr:cobalamin biosynthesis protein CobD [Clostridium ljungdahlii DSM 13528]OAA89883.1 Cobalamin biosynthesis protein CbiB [Clostridium ljungdahlii DSM 13528]